jgi:integrase
LTRLRYHLRSLYRRRKWGRIPAAEFTPATARRWLRSLQRRLKSSHSIDGAYRSLRTMFEWALNEGVLEKLPIRGFKRFWPPCQPRGACTPAEFAALMKAAKQPPRKPGPAPKPPRKLPWGWGNPKTRPGAVRPVTPLRVSSASLRFRLQTWALWNTGCTTRDLRTARWDGLDLEKRLLTTTLISGRPRIVPLSGRAVRVLRWMTRHDRPPTGLILATKSGRPISYKDRFYRKCRKHAGLPEGGADPRTDAEYAALMAAAKAMVCWNGPLPKPKPFRPVPPPKRRESTTSSLRFRLQMWALWNTGCRTCELRTARWEQLDLERGLLAMQEGKTTRKTGRPRVVPLSGRVLRVLRWMTRHGRPTTGPIFTAMAGRPIQRRSFARLFKKYRTLAGLRDGVTAYTLRHGFCVQALGCGLLSETEIAMIMGHANTSLIQWYGRDLEKKTDHLRAKAGLVHARPAPA